MMHHRSNEGATSMCVETNTPPSQPTPLTAQERHRIMRLCLRVTHDRQSAEDLTQETLIEAWRHAGMLRDPSARDRWLGGIARNVCCRWLRAQGREHARTIAASTRNADEPEIGDLLAQLPDATDIELTLERDELATLLDRALALLPPPTRDLLVAHYIHESPHAEIAATLGTSEKAVSMRLMRGKLLLRRLLTTQFRPDAAAYGLLPPTAADGWQETRLWCPLCGAQRLLGRFDRAASTGGFTLRCPGCHPASAPVALSAVAFADLPGLGAALAGVSGYKAAFNRLLNWCATYFHESRARGSAPCPKCGRPARIRLGPPAHWPAEPHAERMIHLRCDHCRITPNVALDGLVLALPEAQQFWRTHRRIRILPPRMITFAGQDALLTTYEPVGGGGALDIVSRAGDYAVLHIAPADGR